MSVDPRVVALQGLTPAPPTLTAIAVAVQGLLSQGSAPADGALQTRGFMANMGTFMGMR